MKVFKTLSMELQGVVERFSTEIFISVIVWVHNDSLNLVNHNRDISCSEAVVWRCSVKKVFLKTSQKSTGKTPVP